MDGAGDVVCCCCCSLSCCCAWKMTKIQPSPSCSVCSSATPQCPVNSMSVASRVSSTLWSTTWRRRTTLPATTSSGSAQAESKVDTILSSSSPVTHQCGFHTGSLASRNQQLTVHLAASLTRVSSNDHVHLPTVPREPR